MRTNDQSNAVQAVSEKSGGVRHVEDELIPAQIVEALQRIENRMKAIEAQLEAANARLASKGSSTRKVVAEKPNVRNQLLGMMMKGWVPETEMLEKAGWTTIGVRSLITKLRTNGFSIESEEREGVPYYRIAK